MTGSARATERPAVLTHLRRGGPAGSRAALLLQHGLFGGAAYWEAQLTHFAGAFDVIAPNLPGFAGTPALPIRSLSDYVALIADLLDALQVGEVAFLGHSLGGMIAQQFALEHPRRTRGLVLYGTAASGELRERFETVEATIKRIEEEGTAACADRVASTWFVAGRRAREFPACAELGARSEKTGAVQALRATAPWSAAARLGAIEAPTLVICGDRDRGTPVSESQRLWRGIDRAELCVLPACAHAAHLEEPALFNAIVDGFLRRLPAAPPSNRPEARPAGTGKE